MITKRVPEAKIDKTKTNVSKLNLLLRSSLLTIIPRSDIIPKEIGWPVSDEALKYPYRQDIDRYFT